MDEEKTVTLQDLLGVMGSPLCDLTMPSFIFDEVLDELGTRYAICIANKNEAYSRLCVGLEWVGARYRRETTKVDKKTLLRKLSQLSSSAHKVILLLNEFSGGPKPWNGAPHLDDAKPYAEFFAEAVTMSRELQDFQMRHVDEQLYFTIHNLELIRHFCKLLGEGFAEIPAKRGQRGLGWYDHLVKVMVEVADLLGIPPSIDARAHREVETPFTALVRSVEREFPEQARSKSPGSCAKRIERSLSRLRRSGQTLPNSVA